MLSLAAARLSRPLIESLALPVHSRPAMPHRRVLVVDDENSQRVLFARIFGARGYQAFTADSALDALGKVHDLCPDLVLADICMPGVDGIFLYKALRAHRETAAIPVLLMTGTSIPASVTLAAANGLGAAAIYFKNDLKGLLAAVDGALEVPAASVGGHTDRGGHILCKGSVSFDLIHRTASVDGRPVPRLAAKRFDVLLAMFRHDGPMSQEELLAEVWGGECDIKTVQMTVARLRADLKTFRALQIRTDAQTYQVLVSSKPAPAR